MLFRIEALDHQRQVIDGVTVDWIELDRAVVLQLSEQAAELLAGDALALDRLGDTALKLFPERRVLILPPGVAFVRLTPAADTETPADAGGDDAASG